MQRDMHARHALWYDLHPCMGCIGRGAEARSTSNRGAEARSPFVASVATVAACRIPDSIALPDAVRWHVDMQQDTGTHVCARERAANYLR